MGKKGNRKSKKLKEGTAAADPTQDPTALSPEKQVCLLCVSLHARRLPVIGARDTNTESAYE